MSVDKHWIVLYTSLFLVLGACSKDGGGGAPIVTPVVPADTTVTPLPGGTQSSVFTYEYKYNGCSTGKHTLNSKQDYCNALLNDVLNNQCAREMRIEVYNRQCTAAPITNVGKLPMANTARCVVNGLDLKDRKFIENMNPFNPQRRQSFRDIFWDGRRKQTYGIMSQATDSYGRVNFLLWPANARSAALGQIQVQQPRAGGTFSASTELGSHVRLIVTNYENQKEVDTMCISNASFRRPKSNLSRVICTYSQGYTGAHNRSASQRTEEFSWDLKTATTKELIKGRNRDTVSVRLIPAAGGHLEKIMIEIMEVDFDKSLKAEATLSEGLQVTYGGSFAESDLTVSCAAASK
ncbi:MAG: hypothetical protein HUU57_04065 [Bdellovibrio sp.]|nr:hypothetical protein [Bdellovibrio sp.]